MYVGRHEVILNLPFQTKTSTRNYTSPEVVADRSKRVVLEHVPEVTCLCLGLFRVDLPDELDPLAKGQVGPVGPVGVVQIIGMQQSVEDAGLVLVHVLTDIDILGSSVFASHVGSVGCSDAVVP